MSCHGLGSQGNPEERYMDEILLTHGSDFLIYQNPQAKRSKSAKFFAEISKAPGNPGLQVPRFYCINLKWAELITTATKKILLIAWVISLVPTYPSQPNNHLLHFKTKLTFEKCMAIWIFKRGCTRNSILSIHSAVQALPNDLLADHLKSYICQGQKLINVNTFMN